MNVVPTLPSRLLRLARRWFGRHAATRVFEPLVADWQHEAAHVQTAHDRALITARWALAFATSSVLVVAGGGEPVTRHAIRATLRILLGALVFGALHGAFRGFEGASVTAAAITAVSAALSVLPSMAVGISRQRHRFARGWRPLLLVTLAAFLAQLVIFTLAWPWIVAALSSPAHVHWGARLHLLVASALPGVLGVAMARVCSRRLRASELQAFMMAYPMWAWGDVAGGRPPAMSVLMGVVIAVWARNVIQQERTRRAQHRARVARNLRLAARPTGR